VIYLKHAWRQDPRIGFDSIEFDNIEEKFLELPLYMYMQSKDGSNSTSNSIAMRYRKAYLIEIAMKLNLKIA